MMNCDRIHGGIVRKIKRVNKIKQYVDGAKPYTYQVVNGNLVTSVQGGVIHEQLVTIYVNGQELATIMCSPLQLEALAIGFLFNESVIESYDEIGLVRRNVAGTVIDILLTHNDFNPPRRMILTSGCGGGVTWQQLSDTYPALESEFSTSTKIILQRMQELKGAARLYNLVRGVHIAVLSDVSRLLANAEDVGRHNAIDKVAGQALMSAISTRDCILLTSGRISSEMLGKARRMQIPVVASRTAPTSITVQLADAWKICVVGYVRQGSMRVYTHPSRLGLPEQI
jgi:FdhD protein